MSDTESDQEYDVEESRLPECNEPVSDNFNPLSLDHVLRSLRNEDDAYERIAECMRNQSYIILSIISYILQLRTRSSAI